MKADIYQANMAIIEANMESIKALSTSNIKKERLLGYMLQGRPVTGASW